MKNYILYFALSLLLSGCATSLNQQRVSVSDAKTIKKIENIEKLRITNIKTGDTYFSKKLDCLGKYFYSNNKDSFVDTKGDNQWNNFLRFSVSPIFDKTQKIYPPGSTAASDLVINALSKIKGISVVETPLEMDPYLSRNTFDIDGNSLPYIINTQFFHSAQKPPLGVLFPSQYYISGAIVQYDERNELGNTHLNANLKYASGTSGIDKLTIGIQLRLVDAHTGKVVMNPETLMPNSIYLKNDLYSISDGLNFFRIVHTSPYGIDYSLVTSDPVQYSLNEIIERGVYDLIKPVASLTENQIKVCDHESI